MYLKRIKAYGFKSFADKTEIELKTGITAVVGPNGSGKSNVVDAVKWVLGEQSVKNLRASGAMSDVIFAGSKSRNPQTRAMVSLTFDNTDHYLNSDLSELEIKRAVYKTGENEYYINGVKSRLKDITDLFIDSGASKESFNIISQGSITDVIVSKPEDRRSMFESAAGVLKYKKRKEESVRKLEKTKENLERIRLIVEELETTVTPLKDQALKAEEYLGYKNELEKIEIALIASDITSINDNYKRSVALKEELEEELKNIDVTNSEDYSKIEKQKNEIVKLEEKLTRKQEKFLEINNEIAELNSQKKTTIERKKYQAADMTLQNSMVLLKEEILNLRNEITTLEKELDLLKDDKDKKYSLLTEKRQEINTKQTFKNTLSEKLQSKQKLGYDLKSKIEILSNQIENDEKLPTAVKSVLNNPRLSGVHSIIGKLIETSDQYSKAIETVLGYSANVIVVDNESVAKNSISYLKDNKLGRATFFPLNVIKPKFIDTSILDRVRQIDGFIGVAADLVEYNQIYSNIIKNQLGNVIVVDTIDTLNMVGRIIEYRYRIVSLTGEILQAGGAITGGESKYNANGVVGQKNELESLNRSLETTEKEVKSVEKELAEVVSELSILEENEYLINKECVDLNELVVRKEISLRTLKETYHVKNDELEGTKNGLNNKLDSEVDKILEKYYKKVSEKEVLDKEIEALKGLKSDTNDLINDLESKNRQINSEYNKKQNELHTLEVNVAKMDVQLDNLLNNLSENYAMTYDKAFSEYSLDIDVNIARGKVNSLKSSMKALGDVNTGAIAEYERLNTRYTFLTNQKYDLETSVNSLLGVIAEMDEIMKDKFAEAFSKVNLEFATVFKKLFKGGEGKLKLTDPDNILETGIEIIAQPPGKKLSTISLLSGGEKTLTAIALLFAILNVKPSPFVVLDEVEAALDDANVVTFGNYLTSKKDLSQFIIITHKKKTMEYADVLYGITMQESGVSKLVSVELEALNK